jgi:SAM-dependent methyltransferase
MILSDAYPLRKALLAQMGGLAVVMVLVIGLKRLAQVDPAGIAMVLAMLQGGIAAMIALRQRAPSWWMVIHLGFVPLLVLVQGMPIEPGWFLAGFILLLLLFWRTDRTRVPLYLSNRVTSTAVLDLLPASPCRLIDLGCGEGGLLARLATARPDCDFVGIEHAPLPWLLAKLRAATRPNLTIRRGDFWQVPLAGYGLVYAFLSPAPMARLWAKATEEMAHGTLLVSNSFPVPDASPEFVVELDDRRETRLFCYRRLPDR